MTSMTRAFRNRLLASTFATVLAMAIPLTACGGASGGGVPAAPTTPAATRLTVKVWETTGDKSKLLAPQADLTMVGGAATGTVITVDPSQTFQSITGFGASITDASAYLIQQKMSSSQRDALMRDLFSDAGLGFSFTRLTIGASDFSSTHYSYDDMPAGQTDPSLAHFSIASARTDVIPTVKQALALNPKLTVMASPWSAPGWMKTSDSLITGSLKPEAYPYFADYLTRYVKAMGDEGVPITMLTLQNEPGFEPADYPGMRVEPASRAAFIGGHLGPKLAASGKSVKILDYDHNWDLASSPLTVLGDKTANPYVAGVAWHCYGGDVSAQSSVHNAYPDKETYFTECSGGEWASAFGESFAWTLKTLVVNSTRHWSKGVLMWNLALDENFGPHKGGCGNCRGVVTIDSKTGAVTRNLEYYAFGHASKFVKTGAVRIASDSLGGIDTVAFKNPDGSIALIAVNAGTALKTFVVSSAARTFSYSLPAQSGATFVWTQ
ncbi:MULTISPECIES: glycoside hydrolase family 30 beta sandwich domain-containing protein [Asticcacaulis]|uniref:glycoside hydrolase family 30 protein n=1 Tax=Asticcacaulis TaxID=76890 RepID=UPI001FDA7FF1|nr:MULTISPECIES: glycoside hydrolase family 30 beta sandwich domain-containing protein [Asticcacaulis]MBP2161623.1 glucosylceramidase [Asticcacaulis solisilvae]MDR6802668.1 glucosylceramidase [Asticcacaulis sp. BE141]